MPDIPRHYGGVPTFDPGLMMPAGCAEVADLVECGEPDCQTIYTINFGSWTESGLISCGTGASHDCTAMPNLIEVTYTGRDQNGCYYKSGIINSTCFGQDCASELTLIIGRGTTDVTTTLSWAPLSCSPASMSSSTTHEQLGCNDGFSIPVPADNGDGICYPSQQIISPGTL